MRNYEAYVLSYYDDKYMTLYWIHLWNALDMEWGGKMNTLLCSEGIHNQSIQKVEVFRSFMTLKDLYYKQEL